MARRVPYQRNGRWCGAVDLRGKKHWVGTFDTKAEWEDAAARLRLQLRAIGPEPDMTVGDFVGAGWPRTHPKPNRTKPSTIENLEYSVRPLVREFAARRLRGGISRPEARAWAIRVGESAAGVARQVFNDAIDDGLAETNPFAKLGLTRSTGRRNIKVLSNAEFVNLVSIAEDSRTDEYGKVLAAIVLWQGTVGTRPGEAWALTEADLDPRGLQAVIRRRADNRGRLDVPKNGLERIVRVPPPTMRLVLEMPRLHETLLFPTLRGSLMRPPAWRWYWNPIRAAFGATLPHGHWLREREALVGRGERGLDIYELRHRAATWMSEPPPNGLGLDPAAVAAQLGHTDGGLLVTKLYRHMNIQDALDRVAEAFNNDADDRDDV